VPLKCGMEPLKGGIGMQGSGGGGACGSSTAASGRGRQLNNEGRCRKMMQRPTGKTRLAAYFSRLTGGGAPRLLLTVADVHVRVNSHIELMSS